MLLQFGKGPTYWTSGGREEDHEALQHTGSSQANVPRAQAFEALEA